MSTAFSIQSAFKSAVNDFLNDLTDKSDYKYFSGVSSINHIYDETDKIQQQQGSNKTLRNLNRVKPYLHCINQYSGVIDTLVQAKPDILALLWGPIKLLLQVSSTYVKSFEKLLEVTKQLADRLPQFQVYESLFKQNSRINHILCLFYRDILDFYAINLNFFKLKGWKIFFESLWPRYADKILVVQDNITRHKILLDSEVTVTNIVDAYDARCLALKEFEENRQSREQLRFKDLKDSMMPRLYDADQERLLETCCRDTGYWVQNEALVQCWSDPDWQKVPLLWLSGIPGAGKTHLCAVIIEHMRQRNQNLVFAFLDYKSSETAKRIEILHSFIFQLLHDHIFLREIVLTAHETNYRKLMYSTEYVLDLLRDLLTCLGNVHIVIDGLDEIKQSERMPLLKALMELCNASSGAKLLISSREEFDISRLLRQKAKVLAVELRNTSDIALYVQSMVENLLDKINPDLSSALQSKVRTLVKPISTKSEGMFLYARLVMENLMSQPNLLCLEREVNNLPNGLKEAYGRIISRINDALLPNERSEAKAILKWIACSEVTLREEELRQAVMIQMHDKKFDPERRLFQDLVQLCGPILEIRGEYVNFVHFTAKEYLCGAQSDNYIRGPDTHRHIAMICMTYLTFDYFDLGLLDSVIDAFILEGSYVLLMYAESFWLEHIKQGLRERADLRDLCWVLQKYLDKYANSTDQCVNEKKPQAVIRDFLPLQENWPVIYDKLSAMNFSRKQNQFTPQVINGSLSEVQELQELSSLCERIQARFDALASSSKNHALLQKHYGTLMFKCNRRSCKFFRFGFASKAQRDYHMSSHERLFKCSQSACDFSVIGFTHQSQLNEHMARCHLEKECPEYHEECFEYHDLELSDFEENRISNMLHDAIEIGNAAYFQALLKNAKQLNWTSLMERALEGTCREIVEILVDTPSETRRQTGATGIELDRWIVPNPVYQAAKTGPPEIVSWLLSEGADPCKGEGYNNTPLEISVRRLNPEIIQVLLPYCTADNITIALKRVLRLLTQNSSAEEVAARLDVARLLVEHGAVPRFIDVLEDMLDVWSSDQVEFLIEFGADVNEKTRGDTPLYFTVRRNIKKSLQSAKVLLENGADPTIPCGPSKRLAKDLAGARSCPKYLGMTWDELVESTWGSRHQPTAEFSSLIAKHDRMPNELTREPLPISTIHLQGYMNNLQEYMKSCIEKLANQKSTRFGV